jgi:hypothetical protein
VTLPYVRHSVSLRRAVPLVEYVRTGHGADEFISLRQTRSVGGVLATPGLNSLVGCTTASTRLTGEEPQRPIAESATVRLHQLTGRTRVQRRATRR